MPSPTTSPSQIDALIKQTKKETDTFSKNFREVAQQIREVIDTKPDDALERLEKIKTALAELKKSPVTSYIDDSILGTEIQKLFNTVDTAVKATTSSDAIAGLGKRQDIMDNMNNIGKTSGHDAGTFLEKKRGEFRLNAVNKAHIEELAKRDETIKELKTTVDELGKKLGKSKIEIEKLSEQLDAYKDIGFTSGELKKLHAMLDNKSINLDDLTELTKLLTAARQSNIAVDAIKALNDALISLSGNDKKVFTEVVSGFSNILGNLKTPAERTNFLTTISGLTEKITKLPPAQQTAFMSTLEDVLKTYQSGDTTAIKELENAVKHGGVKGWIDFGKKWGKRLGLTLVAGLAIWKGGELVLPKVMDLTGNGAPKTSVMGLEPENVNSGPVTEPKLPQPTSGRKIIP